MLLEIKMKQFVRNNPEKSETIEEIWWYILHAVESFYPPVWWWFFFLFHSDFIVSNFSFSFLLPHLELEGEVSND
jgi:hypothetical protein